MKMINWIELAPGQWQAQVPGLCKLVVIRSSTSGQYTATVRGSTGSTDAGEWPRLALAKQSAEIKAGQLMMAGLQLIVGRIAF